MDASATPASPPKPRRTAQDREVRRRRIFGRLQEGWSYEAIAEEEGLTRERIRQIVAETLGQREVDPSADHNRLQIVRLDPALRLTAEKVAAGDLQAVDRLLRVLARLDRYQSADAIARQNEDPENIKEKLYAKLSNAFQHHDNAVAAERRRLTEENEDAAGAGAPGTPRGAPETPRGAPETQVGAPETQTGFGEAGNAFSKFFSR
jgi:hypothetical protein